MADFQSFAKKGQFNPQQIQSAASGMRNAFSTYNNLQGMADQSAARAEGQALQDEQIYYRRGLAEVKEVGKDLQSLGKLSKTLGKQLYDQQERINKQEMAEGMAESYEYGVTEEEIAEHQAGVAELKKGEEVFQEGAASVFRNGGDYSQAERIKGMSGWRQYGFAVGIAKQASEGFGPWLEQQLAGLEGSLPEKAAAIVGLRNQYMDQMGLTGMNKVLLAEHAFPGMRKSESAAMGALVSNMPLIVLLMIKVELVWSSKLLVT